MASTGRVVCALLTQSVDRVFSATPWPRRHCPERVDRGRRSDDGGRSMDNSRRTSRRDLLFGRFVRGRDTTPATSSGDPSVRGQDLRAQPAVIPVHRPPGALDEQRFLQTCTRCGDCLIACPHQAIVWAPERLRQVAHTPVIQAYSAPCRMCADLPCATACTPAALDAHRPLKMADVHIQSERCLPFCRVCAERCPVPGAIQIRDGRLVVDETTCTGCGVCLHVCPAPGKAVLLLPLRDRPGGDSTGDGGSGPS